MKIKFIDLFSGIGGIRLGLEQACMELGYDCTCVFSSEIKAYAVAVLNQNYPNEKIWGDITLIDSQDIPDFDILCAGFPCQAFSFAGTRKGFADTRGTLFFDIARILAFKKPKGFILENVEGLVNHSQGKTLATITAVLEQIGYKISYKVLNSRYFGVAQERKRIYIVGTFAKIVDLDCFHVVEQTLSEVLSTGLPTINNSFTNLLLAKYKPADLYGKSIKDKRGGTNNIHSWDIGVKGEISDEERELLNLMLKERRKKKWATEYGIEWMDGMPLTLDMIATFYPHLNLTEMLENLSSKGYIVKEHPKKKLSTENKNGISVSYREQDLNLPLGYNIVSGKLSFEINKILHPSSVAPTLVAMDMAKLAVVDNNGLRRLTLREGLRLFGYPDNYKFAVSEKQGFDLLGNTVVVPVIKAVCKRLIKSIV